MGVISLENDVMDIPRFGERSCYAFDREINSYCYSWKIL